MGQATLAKLVLAITVDAERVGATLRQLQRATGLPGLSVATSTDGTPNHDDGRSCIEVDVGPGKGACSRGSCTW